MSSTERIEINPRVMLGKPVVRGTRITVELILRKISEGATEADLLESYPSLKAEDIRAAVSFAADMVDSVLKLIRHEGGKLNERFVVVQPGRIRITRRIG